MASSQWLGWSAQPGRDGSIIAGFVRDCGGRLEPIFYLCAGPQEARRERGTSSLRYTHCEPGQWRGPDEQVTEEDYLIWMGAKYMANMVARPVQSVGDVANSHSANSSRRVLKKDIPSELNI